MTKTSLIIRNQVHFKTHFFLLRKCFSKFSIYPKFFTFTLNSVHHRKSSYDNYDNQPNRPPITAPQSAENTPLPTPPRSSAKIHPTVNHQVPGSIPRSNARRLPYAAAAASRKKKEKKKKKNAQPGKMVIPCARACVRYPQNGWRESFGRKEGGGSKNRGLKRERRPHIGPPGEREH